LNRVFSHRYSIGRELRPFGCKVQRRSSWSLFFHNRIEIIAWWHTNHTNWFQSHWECSIGRHSCLSKIQLASVRSHCSTHSNCEFEFELHKKNFWFSIFNFFL